ncbi:hypothetical protein QR680_003782 [Steinernema hermaphroditum]|uniref:Uncharacterized protein n=1 Tax=Steinernema hermaphroditum TaxID=289476 RepID=A0AA39HMX4_9BILA|nr:hypothetical protein QR680_003782 [Steinernema hermaphroditum]
MDDLPFHFCDAVVSTLKDLPEVSSFYGSWKVAFEDHRTNRLAFDLEISSEKNGWSYSIYQIEEKSISRGLSLQDFLQLPKKYIQILRLALRTISISLQLLDSVGLRAFRSTNDELFQLVKFAKLFMNEPTLTVQASNRKIDALLSHFEGVCFEEICLVEPSPKQIQFLKNQTKFDRLRSVVFPDHAAWPEEIKNFLEQHMTISNLGYPAATFRK